MKNKVDFGTHLYKGSIEFNFCLDDHAVQIFQVFAGKYQFLSLV